jgi:hypothetical protein
MNLMKNIEPVISCQIRLLPALQPLINTLQLPELGQDILL